MLKCSRYGVGEDNLVWDIQVVLDENLRERYPLAGRVPILGWVGASVSREPLTLEFEEDPGIDLLVKKLAKIRDR